MTSDAFAAEVATPLLGLKVAKQKGFSHLICEWDALNVISAINSDQDADEWQGKTPGGCVYKDCCKKTILENFSC